MKNSLVKKAACLLVAWVLGAGWGTGNLIASSNTSATDPLIPFGNGDNSNMEDVTVQVESENNAPSNVIANHENVCTQNDDLTYNIRDMLSSRSKPYNLVNQLSHSYTSKAMRTDDWGKFKMDDWNRIARFYMEYMYNIDLSVPMSTVKDDTDFIRKAEYDSLFCGVYLGDIKKH